MNKNKIIFLIIGGVVILFVLILVLIGKSSNDPTTNSNTPKDFKIWIIGDNKTDFTKFITDFKVIYPKYKTKNIIVESFSDYEEYSYALTSAISKSEAPDVFVLNNNEKESIFANQIIGLDPEVFNPNDFRTRMKGIFSDDLITTYIDGEKEKEVLIGIPVGYETLGIFYNGRYVNDSNLTYISSLNSIISELKNKKPNFVPIGIGNGSTVYNASDIITQFFMLESGVSKIADITGNKLKEPLGTYLFYGDENSDNAYNSRFMELKTLDQNNLDLFSKGEIYMVVGYPRMIKEIDEKGYSTNFLRASPFPHYFSGEGKTLVNYNYFVINKDTINYDLSSTFLSYLLLESGASNYLDTFTYYLPALQGLESDKLEEKIHKDYRVVLKNFIDLNNDYILSSFDKGIKNIYDRNIINVLDNRSNYESAFLNFKNKLLCQTKKIINLENLSKDCK